jgi:hypothetical protein
MTILVDGLAFEALRPGIQTGVTLLQVQAFADAVRHELWAESDTAPDSMFRIEHVEPFLHELAHVVTLPFVTTTLDIEVFFNGLPKSLRFRLEAAAWLVERRFAQRYLECRVPMADLLDEVAEASGMSAREIGRVESLIRRWGRQQWVRDGSEAMARCVRDKEVRYRTILPDEIWSGGGSNCSRTSS